MDGRKGMSAVKRQYNTENDPFVLGSGSGAHQAIGQAHMYLDSLSYFIEFDEVVAILTFGAKSGQTSSASNTIEACRRGSSA